MDWRAESFPLKVQFCEYGRIGWDEVSGNRIRERETEQGKRETEQRENQKEEKIKTTCMKSSPHVINLPPKM